MGKRRVGGRVGVFLKLKDELAAEEGRMRKTREAEMVSNGIMKGGGGLCRSEADVLTSRLADRWDVVNQHIDPYALTSLWMAEGQSGCLYIQVRVLT